MLRGNAFCLKYHPNRARRGSERRSTLNPPNFSRMIIALSCVKYHPPFEQNQRSVDCSPAYPAHDFKMNPPRSAAPSTVDASPRSSDAGWWTSYKYACVSVYERARIRTSVVYHSSVSFSRNRRYHIGALPVTLSLSSPQPVGPPWTTSRFRRCSIFRASSVQ